MAKPPPSGPHSDINGVNRDVRVGVPSEGATPHPGAALDEARASSAARPERGPDLGTDGPGRRGAD